MSEDIFVRFWGVRGSTPVPGPSTLRYGGNTACVEVWCGERLLILDAGTGLRGLGNAIKRRSERIRADVLISHPHLDHLMGLPFFAPLYHAQNELSLWIPKLAVEPARAELLITSLIGPPYFPVPINKMGAKLHYQAYDAGDAIRLQSDLNIKTLKIDHPGGAAALRIEYRDRTLVYLTDVELSERAVAGMTAFVRGADALICDAMFTDSEKADHRGWGHTTWQDAVRLAQMANLSRLILFHHAPARTDAELDDISLSAASILPGTQVAAEGMSFSI